MISRLAAMLGLVLAVGATAVLQSCGDQQQTTQTSSSDSAYGTGAASPATPGTTTTTTTTTSEEPDSVVGATLNAVGTVILFPFRLLGDAIELIV
jgi:hypothetical protein